MWNEKRGQPVDTPSIAKDSRKDAGDPPADPRAGDQSGLHTGLAIARRGATAVVTLDRAARLNAVDSVMRQTLARAMVDFSEDLLLYGVVIRAAPGRAFCAGGDLLELYDQARDRPAEAGRNIAEECEIGRAHV